MQSPVETVTAYFQLLARGPEAAAELPTLLSEDTTFRGPLLRANNRNEFLSGLADFDSSAGEFQMRHLFQEGDHVCAVYDFLLPGGTVANVQLFTVCDGLITAQELIFNLAEFQAAAS